MASVLPLVTSMFAGILLGLSLAAPPGPMNAVIATESVARGWTAGFRAGLGAMSADACFLVLALVGVVTVLERAPTIRAGMLVAGGLLMVFFAYDATRSARSSVARDGTAGVGKGFRKAFVLALTNPFQILWWLTVGVALLEPGTFDLGPSLPIVGSATTSDFVVTTGSGALVGGFFVGIVIWIVTYPAGLVWAGDRVDGFAPVVAYASAVVLLGFGLLFLAEAIALIGWV